MCVFFWQRGHVETRAYLERLRRLRARSDERYMQRHGTTSRPLQQTLEARRAELARLRAEALRQRREQALRSRQETSLGLRVPLSPSEEGAIDGPPEHGVVLLEHPPCLCLGHVVLEHRLCLPLDDLRRRHRSCQKRDLWWCQDLLRCIIKPGQHVVCGFGVMWSDVCEKERRERWWVVG